MQPIHDAEADVPLESIQEEAVRQLEKLEGRRAGSHRPMILIVGAGYHGHISALALLREKLPEHKIIVAAPIAERTPPMIEDSLVLTRDYFRIEKETRNQPWYRRHANRGRAPRY